MRTEEISIDLSAYQPKLVVHCILNPEDEDIVLKLTQTLPPNNVSAFDKIDLLVPDATVVVSNANTGEWVGLMQSNDSLPFYRSDTSDLKIIAGEKYNLTIMVDGYESIQAFVIVPALAVQWIETSIKDVQFEFDEGQLFKGIYQVIDSGLDPIVYETSIYWYNDTSYVREYSHFEYEELGSGKRAVAVECVNKAKVINLITPDLFLRHYLELEEFYASNDLWSEVGSFESVYNGILPEYSNIENGFGVFGACLKETITYIPGPY